MNHRTPIRSSLAEAERAEGLARLIDEFEHPSEDFSPTPFWFWNDTLTEAEIARQMRAFKDKGVDGFVIHPRLGLDPLIPYMGEEWLAMVRYAVTLAKELRMKVILYDEAMYPSGSCCGQVVAENPDFRAKGLKMADSPSIVLFITTAPSWIIATADNICSRSVTACDEIRINLFVKSSDAKSERNERLASMSNPFVGSSIITTGELQANANEIRNFLRFPSDSRCRCSPNVKFIAFSAVSNF